MGCGDDVTKAHSGWLQMRGGSLNKGIRPGSILDATGTRFPFKGPVLAAASSSGPSLAMLTTIPKCVGVSEIADCRGFSLQLTLFLAWSRPR